MVQYLKFLRLLFIAGLVFFSLSNTAASNEPPARTILLPDNFTLNTNTNTLQTYPPTLNNQTELIWIGQSIKGLFIVGKIFGEPPQWPKTAAALANSNYIELWLASTDQINLPPIGWGNQFGNEILQSAKDCQRYVNVSSHGFVQQCPQWLDKQAVYRRAFTKLFIRQWQLAPTLVRETYATPAYQYLTTLIQNQLAPLKPDNNPQIIVRPATDKTYAYDFTIFVPWNALPPAQQLTLNHLRLMIKVFNASTNKSPAKTAINPNALDTIQLTKPQNYFITACHYDLQNLLINANKKSDFIKPGPQAIAYFMPTENLDIHNVLIVDNFTKGYQYVPDLNTYSPVIYTENFFAHPLNKQAQVCGPMLAAAANGQIIRTNFVVSDAINSKSLPSGDWLIADGPRLFNSFFGTGQCGVCPQAKLAMYLLDQRTNSIKPIFNYFNIIDPLQDDIDIHLAPDWQSLTIYEGKVNAEKETVAWQAKTYCYQKALNNYQLCRNTNTSPAPAPRVLELDKVN